MNAVRCERKNDVEGKERSKRPLTIVLWGEQSEDKQNRKFFSVLLGPSDFSRATVRSGIRFLIWEGEYPFLLGTPTLRTPGPEEVGRIPVSPGLT